MKRLLAILLVAVMALSLFACGKTGDNDETGNKDNGNADAAVSLAGKKYGVELEDGKYDGDYISLYKKYGDDVTIADVTEDPETGFAYIEKDGTKYELGMDFLSRAMVYNCEVPEGSDKYKTADDVYAMWWKLYIQRWNALLPEIPLYSNEYYDLFNAQIEGVKDNPTNPYWDVTSALIDWTSAKEDKSIIIGNVTELSGKFRYATFGGTNPGAADLDVEELSTGLGTVVTTKDGGYAWNDTVVKSHEAVENEDGTKTYTIEIYDDLKYSDGSAITAKDYLVHTLVFSTPVAASAAQKDHQSGLAIVGFDTFNKYAGEAAEGATKELSGLRLLDTYKFSVTIAADFLPYYYDISYAGFTPEWAAMWIGDAEVKDDGNGAYLTDDFYAKNGDAYVNATLIEETSRNTDTTYPYTGAYVVESYDKGDKSAVLVKNPYFKGNYEGTVPAIEKVVYKLIISSTQLQDLEAGNLDFIAGITGGTETDEALTLVKNNEGKYDTINYSRAGYGKLGFRADYGPVQFTEVRQAIAYCMDRAEFAKTFTGGYGGVVDGPYYTGSWMYNKAKEFGMTLDAYATSADSAKEVLIAGGWVYNAEGGEYKDGVRYKKIPAAEATENDINYKSKDGAYKTTKVGDDYYMPLVLNWFGTSDNPFTDQLVTGFMENDNIEAIGMKVWNNIGDFSPMLDELYQAQIYGYYSGTPMYSVFNFATGFTSAAYDYAYNWSIEPTEFDNYSACYLKDMADVYWLADSEKGVAPETEAAATETAE